MNNEKLSPELNKIAEKLNVLIQRADQKKFGFYPRGAEDEARAEFSEILKEIAENHDALIKKINEDMSDEFVSSGSIFQLGLKHYAAGIKSLLMVAHLVEKKSNLDS